MLKESIIDFFTQMAPGGIPWEHYLDELSKADFGLALRIEADLARQNRGIAIMITTAVLILGAFAISILLNQRKIIRALKKLEEDKNS